MSSIKQQANANQSSVSKANIRAVRQLSDRHLNTHSRPRRAMRPSRCMKFSPKEGVGNAGCPLHPRPRVHLVLVERTRVTTSTPESPDVPARNGFNGFLRALPGEPGLFATITCGYVLSKPGWADLNSANLTPASGRQDHTTSPYATTSLVRSLGNRSQAEARPATPSRAKRCRVHRIPCPTFVTIAKRPSVGRDEIGYSFDLGQV